MRSAAAALAAADTAGRLRRTLYWRTPPLTRFPALAPAAAAAAVGSQLDNNAFLVPLAADAAAAWRASGFRVLDFGARYFWHAGCGRDWRAGNSVGGCPSLTMDGRHPIPAVNLVLVREALSTMAADGVGAGG